MFGTIVLPMAWLPFWSKGQFTRVVPRPTLWLSLSVVALLFALIAWGALSGFNQTSNAWFKEHPEVRFYFAAILWLAWLISGCKGLVAKRFLA
ncbi:MAG: hypothetical protein WB784_10610 [Rhodanobacteraceae bacterium]